MSPLLRRKTRPAPQTARAWSVADGSSASSIPEPEVKAVAGFDPHPEDELGHEEAFRYRLVLSLQGKD